MKKKPVVAIVCNRIRVDDTTAHGVKQQYVRPLVEVVGAAPVLLPAIGGDFDFAPLAGVVDGVLLTGSFSNVAPALYGAERKFAEGELDTDRDATVMPFLKTVLERDIPLFAICRGFQELNVALGGTLHQFVHELPGMADHRGDKSLPLEKRFQPGAHDMITAPGGLFGRIGMPGRFAVNTLHNQGIDRLGASLRVEARAPDGLIEAVSVEGKRFALGVQWHPEGDFWLNPSSKILFEAFREAMT